MMAAQLFVVPRSIPIALAMCGFTVVRDVERFYHASKIAVNAAPAAACAHLDRGGVAEPQVYPGGRGAGYRQR